MAAFISSFAGSAGASTATSPATARRAAKHVATMAASNPTMYTSVAPVISVVNTMTDSTSKVAVADTEIGTDERLAAEILSNMALAAVLKNASAAKMAALPGDAPEPVDNPVDAYFPMATRDEAPVIDLSNGGVSVKIEKIRAEVSGASSAPVPFWKAPVYKYTAPADPVEVEAPEVISTAAFESFIPSARRNRAPVIDIRAPAFPGDTSAYMILSNESISLPRAAATSMGATAEVDNTAPAPVNEDEN